MDGLTAPGSHLGDPGGRGARESVTPATGLEPGDPAVLAPDVTGGPAPAPAPEHRRHALAWYLARRLVLVALTLVVVAVLVFWATQALPGNAAYAVLGRTATRARVEALERQLHLNRPAVDQFAAWFGGLLHGDLGRSLADGQPVAALVGQRLLNSSVLVVVAAVLSVPSAIAIGTWLALRRGRASDEVGGVVTLAIAALPEFVIAVALIVLFATVVLRVLPPVSLVPPGGSVLSRPDELVLPVATLFLAITPYLIRMIRSSVLEVAESDYVEALRLNGCPERTVVARHILPNAIGPTLQVIAAQLAWLAGGIVTVEYVFAFPGIGQALVFAVDNRDIPVIQATVLVLAAVYVLVNLAADILAILVTPRVRTTLQ